LFTKPHGAIRNDLSQIEVRRIFERIISLDDSEWTIRGLQQVAQELGISYKRLFHLFRMAIIDNEAGPPVMELIEFFGISECRKRLQAQLKWLEDEIYGKSSRRA
jgi:lysyl-tRNA synthetase class I